MPHKYKINLGKAPSEYWTLNNNQKEFKVLRLHLRNVRNKKYHFESFDYFHGNMSNQIDVFRLAWVYLQWHNLIRYTCDARGAAHRLEELFEWWTLMTLRLKLIAVNWFS